MDAAELKVILENHRKYLNGITGGACANLQGANLQGANLQDANLQDAKLQGANLQGANLQDANLQGANLQGANLQGAKLQDANLQYANLQGANLQGANLQGAKLQGAKLQGANLQDAKLQGAKGIELVLAQTEIVAREGSIIGWKLCMNNVLVKLKVLEKARRSNALGRKCRAEKVVVLEVIGASEGISLHDGITTYKVGKTVEADSWTEDRLVECGHGIHFFLTKEEAQAYVY